MKLTGSFYSTGQAARELGISVPRMRALCEAGLVETETTPGGHWRIASSEIERLKRDGIPDIPRVLPPETIVTHMNPSRPGAAAGSVGSRLAPPSLRVIESAENLEDLEYRAKAATLERTVVEHTDWREEHDARKEAVDRERKREEEAARAKAEAEQQRTNQQAEWLEYALNQLPYGVSPDTQIELARKIPVVLDVCPLGQPAAVIQRLVDAAVRSVLEGWERQNKIVEIVESAVLALPYNARYGSSGEWVEVATQAAWQAVRSLASATVDEINIAVLQSVRRVITDFQSQERRSTIVSNLQLPWGCSRTDREACTAAVQKAFSACSNNASEYELTTARDAALKPLLDEISREEIIDKSRRQVLFNSSNSLADQAVVKIRTEFKKHPIGTHESLLSQVADKIVNQVIERQKEQRGKERLADSALTGLYSFVSELEREFHLPKEAWPLYMDMKDGIRQKLIEELDGDETDKQAEELMKECVEDALGIED